MVGIECKSVMITTLLLAGIEELLQMGIPEAMKGLDYNAPGLAETALTSAIQELDEVYAMCCCSVSELAGDQARVIHSKRCIL